MKRALAIALLLALAPAAAHAQKGADKAADVAALIGEGKAFFRDKDYPHAFAKFRAAADLDPKNQTALYNAALAARKGGLLEEARVAYGDLLKRAPDDLDAVYGLAEVERALAHNDAAKPLYERYIKDEKRPERQELVEKAKAAIAALPTPVPKAATPSLDRPSIDDDAKAAAQKLFEQGQAAQKLEKFDEAAVAYLAAVDKDAGRVDALLKAALVQRKGNHLDQSKATYERALSSTTATPENQWDATYGLAETERLRGDKLRAADLFERYASLEKRPSEDRYVARAKELAVLLRQGAPPPPTATLPTGGGVPLPPLVTPPVVAAAPLVVPPLIAPPLPTLPTTTTPPPEPKIEPKAEAKIEPKIEPKTEPPAPKTEPPKTEAASSVDFYGDAVVVDRLIEQAQAADAAGATDHGKVLWERARALAPRDPRLPPVAKAEAAVCDADRLLADGEVALANNNPAVAMAQFRRARACDPARAAPLWGLSRAFDAVGAKKQAKHHAGLYARSTAPDRDPTKASKAAWRAEQPD